MAIKMRKVSLLGAFEISPEEGLPIRDGLILGSRRDRKGFVLETNRESIEQILSASNPEANEGFPVRLPLAIGPFMEQMGFILLRAELKPVGKEVGADGAYVQGALVFRTTDSRIRRLLMTATEAIQVAIAQGLPILAAQDLLMLDVAQFLVEIDEAGAEALEEKKAFKSFVDNVTASDFAQYFRDRGNDSKND